MKRSALWLTLAAAAGATVAGAGDPPPAPRRLEETTREIIAKVAPTVVRIEIDREDKEKDDPRRRMFADPESLRRGDDGSGVVLRPDGLILTHRSIALAAKDARVIVATSNGRRLHADVLARDAEIDVALLKVDPGEQPLPAITIGTVDGLGAGRLVLALGNPFNVARDARAAASLGVVQAIAKLDAREAVYQGDVILTDAGVNPGNEGGPLIDLDGRMVGLLAPIVRDRRTDALENVAIPIDAIVPRLEALAKGGVPGRMGILCEPSDRDARGLVVRRVVPGSAAEKAGVREGDRVKSVDGEPIDGVAALARAVEKLHAGSTAKVVVERGGEDVKLDVQLGEGP